MNRCPICSSTLQKMQQAMLCTSQQCNYVEFHPITFTNEVVNGQQTIKKQISRVNFRSSQELTAKEAYLKRCRKEISDCCHILKYPEAIEFLAIRIVAQEIQDDKNENLCKKESFQDERQQPSLKKLVGGRVKDIASFSVYVACYQKSFILEELKIAKYFGFTFKSWKENVQRYTSILKEHIQNLPPIRCPFYLLKKACQASKIRQIQLKAMLEICQKIQKHLVAKAKDSRASTIAALVFWKVCQQSQLYKEIFLLSEICRAHDRMYQYCSSQALQTIDQYFDIKPQSVKTLHKLFQGKNCAQSFFTKLWLREEPKRKK